jgi:uncharacterized membrane protein
MFSNSISVMRALGKLPPKDAISAMQLFNVEIVNPVFLIVFIGSVISCLLTIVGSVPRLSEPNARFSLVGSVVYLVGSIVITTLFNIPRNNSLAGLSPTVQASATEWTRYLLEWTNWNHVRGIAATIATLLLALGLK